jgi:DNA (cytosine-5)-methyltransferase 1
LVRKHESRHRTALAKPDLEAFDVVQHSASFLSPSARRLTPPSRSLELNTRVGYSGFMGRGTVCRQPTDASLRAELAGLSRRDALAWVKSAVRPSGPRGTSRKLRFVDLFSGCGGLSLGVWEACRRHGLRTETVLAVDSNRDAAAVYRANVAVSASAFVEGNITELLDGKNGCDLTAKEKCVRAKSGDVELLVAGPPCQGHSDLNNSTRRNDPRNLLYLRATRAIEVLRPHVALIENVPSVVHDSAGVVQTTSKVLSRLGYNVSTAVVDMQLFGLPQRRRRHVLLAATHDLSLLDMIPQEKPGGSAIGAFIADLEMEPETSDRLVAKAAQITPLNAARIKHLFENDLFDLPDELRPPCHRDKAHSYQSVYGRLRWDRPAQTITSGFGSMGQGRYVHPRRPRMLSPHEAARIQGFPDFFDFAPAGGVTALRTMIGNAVPPPLTIGLISGLLARGAL